MKKLTFLISILLLALAVGAACGNYKSPPVPSIEGADQGVLHDSVGVDRF